MYKVQTNKNKTRVLLFKDTNSIFRRVFDTNNKPSKAYLKALRNNIITELHPQVSNNYLFNTITKRLVNASNFLDKRSGTKKIKKSIQNKTGFTIENGFLEKTLDTLEEKKVRQASELVINNSYGLRVGELDDDNKPMKILRDTLKRYQGKTINITVLYEEIVYFDREKLTLWKYKSVYVPKRNFATWFSSQLYWYMITSFEFVFDRPRTKIIITPESVMKNPRRLITQMFREGKTHCVFQPMKDKLNFNLAKTNNKRRIGCFNSTLKKIEELEAIYDKGVPTEKLQEVVDTLKYNIKIKLPFDKDFLEIKNVNSRETFTYINTQINHIDILTSAKNNEEIKSAEELLDIKLDLENRKEYFTYTRNDLGEVLSISTKSINYKLDSDLFYQITTFESENDFQKYKIDDVKDAKLSEYIKEGTLNPLTVDFIDRKSLLSATELKHIDQTKSYTRFQESQFYQGFLGKITDFRQTNKYQGVGIYTIDNIDLSNADPKFLELNKTMCLLQNKVSYASPFLKCFDKYNVKYDIIAGCWGVKEFHFEFPEEMCERKHKKVGYYSIYTGMCDRHYEYKDYFLSNVSQELFGNIAHKLYEENNTTKVSFEPNKPFVCNNNIYFQTFDEDTEEYSVKPFCDIKDGIFDASLRPIEYDVEEEQGNFEEASVEFVNTESNPIFQNELKVSMKKEANYTFGHFTAFITAYSALNTIEQAMKMDLSKLARICVDGIYYFDHEFEMKDPFREKDENKLENHCAKSYLNYSKDDEFDYEPFDFASLPKQKDNHRITYGKGAGGCGKSYDILTDAGYKKVLFCAPSWKLATNKKNEFGVRSTVWNQITNKDPTVWTKYKNYNVLVIDEVSMMTNAEKNLIINRYPDAKIIFLGDIGFQLPPYNGKVMDMKGIDHIDEYTTNYRIKCPELKVLCNKIRQKIKQKKDINLINEYVIDFMTQRNRTIRNVDLQQMYKIDDMILSSTRESMKKYTDLFKDSFENEKFYFTNTATVGDTKYSNGDILITDKNFKNSNAEVRHCFTVHSIQGETAEKKLFIDVNRLFDITMIYTAISRARYLDQIYLFDSQEPC